MIRDGFPEWYWEGSINVDVVLIVVVALIRRSDVRWRSRLRLKPLSPNDVPNPQNHPGSSTPRWKSADSRYVENSVTFKWLVGDCYYIFNSTGATRPRFVAVWSYWKTVRISWVETFFVDGCFEALDKIWRREGNWSAEHMLFKPDFRPDSTKI